MDVGELLSYVPEQTPKRPNENDSDDGVEQKKDRLSSRSKKLRKLAGGRSVAGNAGATPGHDKSLKPSLQNTNTNNKLNAGAQHGAPDEPQITEEERLNILQYVEQEEPEGDIMDEIELKKMILLFEKRNLRNQEMRIKFPDNPEKFMESEINLHDLILELKVVATVPDLYPIMVELNAIPSLLELLAHQNTDISVAVVDLLQDLSDVDILHESLDGADILIESLRKQQISALLVQNLDRLDENVKEESDGVHNTLAIFENLTEIRPEMCKEAAEQGLMQWLLKRLKVKIPFDANKLYCSEILSILIQDVNDNRLLLGQLDGIDVLLQQLAAYKRHDPITTEEQEFMENLFNCLCSALMAKENRERFLKGEGLQLMNLMLREKKLSRNGSLKVLDHAVSGVDGKENCNKFVDILGLRTIFPLYMKTPKRNKKRLLSADEHEEHVISIIASMLRNCKGSQRQRLLAKFTENDLEKVDRLLELHIKYMEKVDVIDDEIEQQRIERKEQNVDNIISEDDEDEEAETNYMKRLSGGLFTLQLIDYIVLEISATSEVIKQRVLQILNIRGASMKTIRHVMREYAGNLGEAGDSEWRDQEQAHILQLIDRF